MILVGSTYFFESFDDFSGSDKDFVNIVDRGNGYNFIRQRKVDGNCIFDIVKHNKEEIIKYALESKGPAMQVGKFLVPEFCKEFSISIEDIKQLKPLIDKIDNKHKYEEVIYNAYLENGDFYLTTKQLDTAYKLYKQYKENNYGKHNNK